MGHQHSHSHHPVPSLDKMNKAFIIGIILNTAFVLIEAVSGFYFDSLALLSDAGHNLSDVVSLILALLAFRLAKIKPSEKFTYGYKKSTVLISLLNAIILLVAVGIIFSESIEKLQHPQPIEGGAIAWVAGFGILINAFTAFLFFKNKNHDLNVKGAYLHMAADTLVSVGVLVSGIIIYFTNWYIIDSLIGIAIAIVILISTWNLLHDSLRLSLDGVPVGLDIDAIRSIILQEKQVIGIHHLHVWAISTTQNALTAHVVVNNLDGMENLKCNLKHELQHVNIQHATLELELENESCNEECNC